MQKNLKLIILTIIVSFLFLIFSFTTDQKTEDQVSEEERIIFFSSAVSISENGILTIHETIVVECLNININHGIFRDLPLYENSKSFFPKSLQLKILEGKMDGKPSIAKKEVRNGFLRIYLGDPDNIISKGIHTFEIIYSYSSIIKNLNDQQILYLNVTGNYWDFKILKCSLTIVLPEKLTSSENFSLTKIEGYTGKIGEKDKDYNFTQDPKNSNILYFETTKILNTGEGFTVYISYKPPIINTKQNKPSIKYFYSSNPGAFILIAGSILIFLYYFFIWIIVGKDPRKRPIEPSLNIIDKLSPAALRYIWKMGFDTQTLSCAIINLASKGYLKIEFIENGFVLKKKDKSFDDIEKLPSEEKELINLIFSKESIESINEDNNSEKSYYFTKENYIENLSIIRQFKKLLDNNYKNRFFITNSFYYIIGLIASIIFFAVSIFYTIISYESGFIVLLILIWTAAIFGIINVTRRTHKRRKADSKVLSIILTIIIVPFVIFDLIFIAYFLSQENAGILLLNFVCAIFLIILNKVYYKLIKKPTKEGIAIYVEIEGLRKYLLNIQKEIKKEIKKEKGVLRDKLSIDKLLPYSLAMDVENDWFTDLFESSERSYSSDYDTYPYIIPWVSASSNIKVNTYNNITNLLYYLNSTISSSNSSSSFSSSDGGSSGGGSGGGGGGGW